MKFKRDDLEFFLPDFFRTLSKAYILTCIFDKSIQEKWVPAVGDIIVGPSGNIFIISAKHKLVEEMGGTQFYFGGQPCSKDGSMIMNNTHCFVLNKKGKKYDWDTHKLIDDPYYSSFSDFRFVPWPHELSHILES